MFQAIRNSIRPNRANHTAHAERAPKITEHEMRQELARWVHAPNQAAGEKRRKAANLIMKCFKAQRDKPDSEAANTLVLKKLGLTSLPESIGKLERLYSLVIYYNQLTSLPESIGNLTSLTYLDVGLNQLTALPESIGNLKSLTDLSISGNQLTSMPEWIGNLKSLTHLDISRNQLTSMPEWIGNLTSLTRLAISRNQLTALPESIGNFEVLITLDISNNQVTALPKSILKLKHLGILNTTNTLLGEQFMVQIGGDGDKNSQQKIQQYLQKLDTHGLLTDSSPVQQVPAQAQERRVATPIQTTRPTIETTATASVTPTAPIEAPPATNPAYSSTQTGVHTVIDPASMHAIVDFCTDLQSRIGPSTDIVQVTPMPADLAANQDAVAYHSTVSSSFHSAITIMQILKENRLLPTPEILASSLQISGNALSSVVPLVGLMANMVAATMNRRANVQQINEAQQFLSALPAAGTAELPKYISALSADLVSLQMMRTSTPHVERAMLDAEERFIPNQQSGANTKPSAISNSLKLVFGRGKNQVEKIARKSKLLENNPIANDPVRASAVLHTSLIVKVLSKAAYSTPEHIRQQGPERMARHAVESTFGIEGLDALLSPEPEFEIPPQSGTAVAPSAPLAQKAEFSYLPQAATAKTANVIHPTRAGRPTQTSASAARSRSNSPKISMKDILKRMEALESENKALKAQVVQMRESQQNQHNRDYLMGRRTITQNEMLGQFAGGGLSSTQATNSESAAFGERFISEQSQLTGELLNNMRGVNTNLDQLNERVSQIELGQTTQATGAGSRRRNRISNLSIQRQSTGSASSESNNWGHFEVLDEPSGSNQTGNGDSWV